ncbi:MAG: hypothetical protein OMM_10215 [Candidatus Magnetoglobus multicellularis str. Araruama]|uniref:Macro domain-containing protein n=1 Tax=Candidatus Magnetoglobus multicellularis str. Araruama TaxID=890399 RepID=A0A1V1P1I2_9BACT|nr:MAG: hypothetical protein OMM_10215 [Candidatus Magnetoglobus multicellularis str. Araruama]
MIPGKMHVHEMTRLINPRLIINFPTKRHWRGKSRLDDIKSGLSDLIQVIQNKDIKSIALPPLGTGLGGLDWAIVKQLMQNAFQPLDDVRVVIFEPRGAPSAEKMAKNKKNPGNDPWKSSIDWSDISLS